VVFIYTVSGFVRDGRANGDWPCHLDTTLSSCHSQGFEDGPDIGFRNVGQYKPDPGETPKSWHTLHFTLFYKILPFSVHAANNVFKFVYSEITGESAWRVLFRLPWCFLLLWKLKFTRTGTHFDSGLLISRTC
jgi:hypothetical protein